MKRSHTSILDVFQTECHDLVFDKKLYATACQLQEGFVSRAKEHIDFFGGPLTGVHRVRFVSSDRDKLFDLMLGADEYELQKYLYALKDETGKAVINQSYNVSSDVFNLATIWLMHGFATSSHLNEEQREDAKLRVGMYMMYKFLTSLLTHNFKYPADPAAARATYDALSLKFLLKQNGSWGKTIEVLVSGLIGKGSRYYDFLQTLDNDKGIIDMINDMQGRIRGMLKNILAVFYEVRSDGARVGVSAIFQEIEGEVSLRENTESLERYTKYLKRVVSDTASFVRDDLVNLVATLVHTLPTRTMYQSLTWTSQNYHGADTKEIDECIDLVMEHAIDYLTSNRTVVLRDTAEVLKQLRGTYTSSRSTDAKLIKVRASVEKLMSKATGSTNQNTLASARTAWMLYLVVRALSMSRYNS